MFNLKETDVEYYINKEKRTVVCRLKGKNADYTELYALNEIKSVTSGNRECYTVEQLIEPWLIHNIFNLRLSKEQLVGVAKCHPDDVWDERLGKIVAKRKLRYKLGKYAYHVWASVLNTVGVVDYKVKSTYADFLYSVL